MKKIKIDVNQAIVWGALFAVLSMGVGTGISLWTLGRVNHISTAIQIAQKESVLSAKIIAHSALTREALGEIAREMASYKKGSGSGVNNGGALVQIVTDASLNNKSMQQLDRMVFKNPHTPLAHALLKLIAAKRTARSAANQEIKAMQKGDIHSILNLFKKNVLPAYQTYNNAVNYLLVALSRDASRLANNSRNTTDRMRIILGVGGGAAAVFVLLIALIVNNIIKKQLLETNEAVTRVAEGELTVRINTQYIGGTLNRIATSVNNMSNQLHELVMVVKNAAQTVNDKSQEIDALTLDLRTGTSRGDALSEEIRQATHNMELAAANMFEQAESIAGSIQQMGKDAEKSGEQIRSTLTLLGHITEHMDSISISVKRFAESSNKITRLVDSIQEITDQTNMLALNASIEAARAGESGRGFAVVADEVRSLANRSNISVEEIRNAVAAIEKDALSAIKAVQDGEKMAHEGSRQGDQANRALALITDRIHEVTSNIELVSTAAKDQNNQVGQVAENIENISDSLKSIDEKSNDAKEKADDLKKSADTLMEKLTFFKI